MQVFDLREKTEHPALDVTVNNGFIKVLIDTGALYPVWCNGANFTLKQNKSDIMFQNLYIAVAENSSIGYDMIMCAGMLKMFDVHLNLRKKYLSLEGSDRCIGTIPHCDSKDRRRMLPVTSFAQGGE